MAAAPATATARFRKGKSRTVSLPTLKWRVNVIMMDENADVTFGVMQDKYPPWVRDSLHHMHTARAPRTA
eukprot:4983608-Prymnesium_polylepis.1